MTKKLTKQEDQIKDLTDNKAEAEDLDALKQRIDKLENFKIYHEKEALMRGSYDKRVNLLIHGLGEGKDNVWETKVQTREIFDSFLSEALEIDPATIPLVDVHRLPQQHPVKRRGVTINRRIIIKLTNALDKQTIMK